LRLARNHAPSSRLLAQHGKTKKADVVEAPKAFDHVGLLVNKPPGTAELLFT
jgi:hypothetical protein